MEPVDWLMNDIAHWQALSSACIDNRLTMQHLSMVPAGVNYNAVSLLRRLFDRLTRTQSVERLGAAVGLMFCAR
jgi:hypothetical protein